MKLSDVLLPTLERIGPKGVWNEAKLRKVWREAVGEQVSVHAEVRRLRGTVLEVWVSSDTWATELTYLAPAVITKLNARMGGQTVSEIQVFKRRGNRA